MELHISIAASILPTECLHGAGSHESGFNRRMFFTILHCPFVRRPKGAVLNRAGNSREKDSKPGQGRPVPSVGKHNKERRRDFGKLHAEITAGEHPSACHVSQEGFLEETTSRSCRT